MAEYIEREALRLAIFNTCWQNFKNVDIAYDMADSIPAADVAPVVHGKWKIVNVSNVTDGKGVPVKVVHCSNCGFTWSNIAVALKHFKGCPNCLARMDGE